MDNFNDSRLGMFTASEMHKLMAGGRRDMTPEELAARPAGDKRKTVDTLFGDTALTYIYDKVTEQLNLCPAPQIEKWELQWGLENEAAALSWYMQLTGEKLEIYGATNYKFFDYNDYSGCSPDAIVIGKRKNVQVKCPANSTNHTKYLVLPENRQQWLKENQYAYYVQCQFEMMCCRTDACDFIVFDPRKDDGKYKMVIIELAKDIELCDEIDRRLVEAQRIKREILKSLNAIPDISVKTPKQKATDELAELEKQWDAQKNGAVQLTIHDTENDTPVTVHDKI